MVKVLMSNLPLPFGIMGSWTFEFDYFLNKNKDFFDFVVSPSPNKDSRSFYAKKRPWLRGTTYVRNLTLKNWVVKDFISAVKTIGRQGKPLQILVVDDLIIAEGVALIKSELPIGTELVFYYHGHSLFLPPQLQMKIDKVFFLTSAGYLESLRINTSFTPEVVIMGNGVSSEIFFPLSKTEKMSQRNLLGFKQEQKIICWLANSRPVKGIHLFGKMIPRLLELDPTTQVITIGHEPNPQWNHPNVLQLGRLTSNELARYLQISDFYFFTSLWKEGFGLSLVEAIKCGNYILCSDNGGISSVVEGYSRVSLIKAPNIIDAWIDEFQKVCSDGYTAYRIEEDQFKYLNTYYSLESWETKLKSALH